MRPAVADVLRLAVEAEKNGKRRLEIAAIRQGSNLGSVQVEAMPRYARGTGLLNSDYLPTLFGRYVIGGDSLLEHTGTQWLMHYHLSAEHGFGPVFWHEIVVSCLLGGEELTRSSVANRISVVHERTDGEPINAASAGQVANTFLGTYSKQDGLGGLGILRQRDDHYIVLDPDPPPVWAVAYALLDFWEAQFGDQVSAGLNELYGEKGLTSLFMISRGRLNTMLEAMQAEGMLELHLIAAPYQVMLLRRDREWVLGKLYGADHAE
jgi:hypothetical protein